MSVIGCGYAMTGVDVRSKKPTVSHSRLNLILNYLSLSEEIGRCCVYAEGTILQGLKGRCFRMGIQVGGLINKISDALFASQNAQGLAFYID
jgi:hypothetical protein